MEERLSKISLFEGVKKGEVVLEMRGITKRFPGVLANDHIDFELRAGEIHALLGENGAGKTTLMNSLYGFYQPDEGEIYLRGKKIVLKSPSDAIALGIGMVHQHFMLVPSLTVIENVILGLKSPKEPLLNIKEAEKRIKEISDKYCLGVKPEARIYQLSIGEQQRIEILKALYRGAQILILDEPTATLTPQETKELIAIMKSLAKENLAVIPFITHKMPEVMAVSDRVTILRQGKVVGTYAVSKVNEEKLAEMMVGRKVLFSLSRKEGERKRGKVLLEIKGLKALNEIKALALRGLSLSLYEGEILGLAGVSGNGQRELAEVIMGLRKATGGEVLIMDETATNKPTREIIEKGVSLIPEDRRGMGSILSFSIAENLILEMHTDQPFAHKSFLPFNRNWFLNKSEMNKYADRLISEFSIMTPNKEELASHLSGGNLQKLILAREFSRNPKIVIAANPTRGLDVGATEYVHERLIERREAGAGILLISDDLDEILMMSDRIAVIYEGEIVGVVEAEQAKVEEIGLMMAGAKRDTSLARKD